MDRLTGTGLHCYIKSKPKIEVNLDQKNHANFAAVKETYIREHQAQIKMPARAEKPSSSSFVQSPVPFARQRQRQLDIGVTMRRCCEGEYHCIINAGETA
jgi:hypothetical protein